MIIDLHRFVEEERPYWTELERLLDRVERTKSKLTIQDAQRVFYLHQRTCSDLAKLNTFASEPAIRQYLEGLVARAYCEVHERRTKQRFRPIYWLLVTFPCTFRRHFKTFMLSTALLVSGMVFGAIACSTDTRAKEVLIPQGLGYSRDAAKRVANEEKRKGYQTQGHQGTAAYFRHNTTVSFNVIALGFTFGIGTAIMLFYNGIIVGAIGIDYIMSGETTFLFAWLMPHGVVEIPAILIGGQAGLVLASAIIGWKSEKRLRQRLREATPDVVTLALGTAVMLLWAGAIESWFSQTHEPVLPYALKISFAIIELIALCAFFIYAGRRHRSGGDLS